MTNFSTSLYFQKILFILKKKKFFFISFTHLTKKNIFITKKLLKNNSLSFLKTPIYPLYLSYFENKHELINFLSTLKNNNNNIFYIKYNYIIFLKNIKYSLLITTSKILLNLKKIINNFKIIFKFKIN